MPLATAQAWSRYTPSDQEASVGMNGTGGMSPRKQMAQGKLDSGASCVQAFPAGRPHPDAAMGGRRELSDSDRANGGAITHTKGMLPAQAAPTHGPHFEREMGYRRDGKA